MTDSAQIRRSTKLRRIFLYLQGVRLGAFRDRSGSLAYLTGTIVTAVCIVLFLIALAVAIGWLQSWDLWRDCGGFVHGTDRVPCPVEDSGY